MTDALSRPLAPVETTESWQALSRHAAEFLPRFKLQSAFAEDPARFEGFSMEAPEVFVDLSKGLWDRSTREWLMQLAHERQVLQWRDAMVDGQAINRSEGREVLHMALRAPNDGSARQQEVHAVLDAMLEYAESVRDTDRSGITDVVNIGIGGSDLGAQMVVPALEAFVHPGLRMHFVSNVDGHDMASVLRKCRPHSTLFIVASKTFTTQETLANAHVARQWFLDQGGTDLGAHFVGVTTNLAAAADFGIRKTFGFWDWVGGRYSLWSAVGLPIAVAIGAVAFRSLLAGAHAMDQHFLKAPMQANVPMQWGLLDVWYRNFLSMGSRSVAPYHQGLRRLPAYLQQLEMESNGKRVDRWGQTLNVATSPVIWGEPGTNGQHAYFQMLHQGTDVIPVEFVLVREPMHPYHELHTKLLANGLAQAQALMLGKSADEALPERAPTANPSLDPQELARHRTFPGNRPSATVLMDSVTPRSLGALIAMYEHRVFVSAAIWGINAFDQWGVELGKAMANGLLPKLASGEVSGLDGSTAGLLRRIRRDGAKTAPDPAKSEPLG